MPNWNTNGNAVGAGDFLGTTNAQPLAVRTNGAERLRVDADGQVGVGLSDPRTQVHVRGRIATGLDFSSAGAVTLFPPDGFAWFHIDNGPAGGRPIGRLRLSHGETPGAHELMTLVQNGNVGVGTPTPAVKMHVVGNRLRLESGGRALDLRADGASVDVQSDTNDLYLHSSGPRTRNRVVINPFGGEGNVGIGTTDPQNKLHVVGTVRADDFLVTSDARLKTKVRPITGALRKVLGMRGVEFERPDLSTESSAGRRLGVMAQDVEAVEPGAVGRGEDGYRGVHLNGLIGLLVEAVRQLDDDNRSLRARLDALEGARTSATTAGSS